MKIQSTIAAIVIAGMASLGMAQAQYAPAAAGTHSATPTKHKDKAAHHASPKKKVAHKKSAHKKHAKKAGHKAKHKKAM